MIRHARKLLCLGFLIILCGVANVRADEFEYVINGKSVHINVLRENIVVSNAAELALPGSAKCNRVYFLADIDVYILGGCDREHVGVGAATPGADLYNGQHGRLRLSPVK